MQHGSLSDLHEARLLFARVSRTTNAWERLRGLLGRPPLRADEGLLLVPCASVHTFGMTRPIDVVYLDRDWRILRIVAGLRPGRVSWTWRAVATLELAAGAAAALMPGQVLHWAAHSAPGGRTAR